MDKIFYFHIRFPENDFRDFACIIADSLFTE